MVYGHRIKNLWHLDENTVFLNNGSFGAVPKEVLDKQRNYIELTEKNPVSFIIDKSPQLLNESNSALAKFINSKPENIAFVENATTAVNSVLNFLINQKKISGKIIYSNHTYPAVINTLKYYEKYFGLKLECINIPYPTNNNEIIELFRKSITKDVNIAVIDTISSSTGMIFPYNELSKLFKENNIITIIDGAHAVGCLDLDLSNPNYDFLTSNNHKWLFSPKGSAFLYSSDEYLNEMHPLSISLFFGLNYRKEFEWQGTKDLSAWITLKDSIDFYKKMGNIEIRNYNNKLIVDAKKLILSKIDTYSISDEMNCSLSTFYLTDKFNNSPDLTMRIRKYFLENYAIEIPFMLFDEKIWFRITAQIFNEISDYQKLVDALNDFKKKNDFNI